MKLVGLINVRSTKECKIIKINIVFQLYFKGLINVISKNKCKLTKIKIVINPSSKFC